MEIIVLNQASIDEAREQIISVMNEKRDAVFIVDHEKPLNQYIEALELNLMQQMQLRICQELKNLDVTLHRDGEEDQTFTSFSELFSALDHEVTNFVIVNGDIGADAEKKTEVRIQVSNIVQQLIYLNIQLDRIQVMSAKEAQDIELINQFEQKVYQHIDAIDESEQRISACAEDPDGFHAKIRESISNIRSCLQEASRNELKIAVAASKKSGKSVVVNSMIEQELAPTSLELATPNNCIYKQNPNQEYTLSYTDRDGSEVALTFNKREELKSHVRELFKQAETDYANGLTCPDMHIGYPANHSGFTQYTVYDTPGPDIGDASKADEQNVRVGHLDAAKRAIREADVIVFTIDYSKYLIQTELDYLMEIKQLFDEEGKNYSLILNVNKLDMRYDNEDENKNVVRILDFIKQRLVSLSPDFKTCIVTGTSALTYFNTIAAPQINRLTDCSILESSGELRDTLEEVIDSYTGEPEMTVLNQLEKMVTSARRFHKQNLKTLGDVRMFSGMPNMLAYVRYVAVNKARAEKLNALMFRIEQEYVKIQNIFHFQELEEELLKNREQLETARQILKDFEKAIIDIYDEEGNEQNQDLFYLNRENPDALHSTMLASLSRKFPIELGDLMDKFKSLVDADISLDQDVDNYANNTLDARIRNQIRQLFAATAMRRDGKPVIYMSQFKANMERLVNPSRISADLTVELTNSRRRIQKQFEDEYENIKYDLTELLKSRRRRMNKAADECRAKLNETCSLPFSLEIPRFLPEFSSLDHQSYAITLHSIVSISPILLSDYSAATGKTFFEKLRDILLNNSDLIFQEDALTFYRESGIKAQIRQVVKDSDNAREPYRKTRENLVILAQQMVGQIQANMQASREMAFTTCLQIREVLDHTDDYETNIKDLEQKKMLFKEYLACIQPFADSWNRKG